MALDFSANSVLLDVLRFGGVYFVIAALANPQKVLFFVPQGLRTRLMAVRLALSVGLVPIAWQTVLAAKAEPYDRVAFGLLATACLILWLCPDKKNTQKPVDSNWIVYPVGRVSDNYNYLTKTVYFHDTRDMSCTCQEWMLRRSIYPVNDPRRLCEHLLGDVVLQNMMHHIDEDPQTLLSLYERGFGYPLR